MTEPAEPTMTNDEMRTYATQIAEGTRSVKRSELVPFMRAFLLSSILTGEIRVEKPALSILGGAPAADVTPVLDISPISITETNAVHVPRVVNHTYSPADARVLANKILSAATRAATPL